LTSLVFSSCEKTPNDLAHGDAHLIVAIGEVIATGSKDTNAQADEHAVSCLLDHQRSSEAAGVLDDHRGYAVANDPR